MKFFSKLCALFFVSTVADQDTILNPIKDGPAVGLVIIQGAQIATDTYTPLAKAIQNAAPYKLFVAIPAYIGDVPEPLQLGSGIDDAKSKMYAAGLPKDAPIVYAGHSLGGAMLQDYVFKCKDCAAQVLMGAGLLRKYRNGTASTTYPVPTLTLDGTLDGLMRVTRQAENYYHYILHSKTTDSTNFPVGVFEGMNHMQFSSGTPPGNVKSHDLAPEISNQEAWDRAASAIVDFMNIRLGLASSSVVASSKANMATLVKNTGALVAPLISAFEQEGFKHFIPACDSDYPMPDCPVYPRYPSGQQGNTPQTNCLCGTPFIQTVAQQSMGGLTDVEVVTTDAIHPVSDLQPIHLPHIWSNCSSEAGCKLNVTTVTYPVYSALDSFDTGFYYASASELKVKLKSRQSIWLAAGRKDVDFNQTDATGNPCADINKLAYQWALKNAGPKALARFEKIGEPLDFGDDIFLGNAGPVWIENPLEYNEAKDKSKVTIRSPCSHTPVDYPIKSAAGYHYCKLLSPARAMEWIYIDGLRNKGHI
mmetsp:Transcript_29902/g.58622  ORF Transcript_29902/g.58622 Transcript_29902/m.58622 type:complete len:533 (-) Transcript_29902:194-1792(-)|eukprot:CAMPEP_0175089390 /NCGR_PEP_ID=MMETSP0086_2-20121207/760_1 /TAXON_ID=136419 /ORGANISM="Unknown Unknown, Strain D1" /LENGTH=532 /DNA_ID=CAMNT_0016361895 /DNA_START=25 /DNA_END=1623 /DNA_ORIENTATION=+